MSWLMDHWWAATIPPYMIFNMYIAWSFARDQGEWSPLETVVLGLAGTWVAALMGLWSLGWRGWVRGVLWVAGLAGTCLVADLGSWEWLVYAGLAGLLAAKIPLPFLRI